MLKSVGVIDWIAYSTTSLWVVLIGMIAHDHGNVKFVHYTLQLYDLADLNHTIGPYAQFLRDLEKQPTYFLRSLFENVGLTPIFKAVLDGEDAYLDPRNEHVIAKCYPSLFKSNWTTAPRSIKIVLCLSIGLYWLRKTFSKRCLYIVYLWTTCMMILMHLLGNGT